MTIVGVLDAALAALHGPWLYLAVGALAAAECAALVGMIVPGETALVLGGVAAGLGQANLAAMLAVAVVGAVCGDQIGFVLGRYLGRRLRHGRLSQWIGEHRWRRAEAFVLRRGGPAVFLGRWVGVLRAAVPAVAGAAGMPRRVFTIWNAFGGVLWASAVVMLGALAGRSWPRIQTWVGTAGWVVGAAAVLAVLVAVAAHHHRGRRRPMAGRDLASVTTNADTARAGREGRLSDGP